MLESVIEETGLQLVAGGEIPIVLTFSGADHACRALTGGSLGAKAIEHSGEEKVRQAVHE